MQWLRVPYGHLSDPRLPSTKIPRGARYAELVSTPIKILIRFVGGSYIPDMHNLSSELQPHLGQRVTTTTHRAATESPNVPAPKSIKKKPRTGRVGASRIARRVQTADQLSQHSGRMRVSPLPDYAVFSQQLPYGVGIFGNQKVPFALDDHRKVTGFDAVMASDDFLPISRPLSGDVLER